MKILKEIGLFILPIHLIFAFQNISGFMSDNNGNPIEYCTIIHLKNGSWTITDENGFFLLQSTIFEGDTLEISRIGFNKKHCIIKNSASIQVSLSKNVIGMAPVSVEGKSHQFHEKLSKEEFAAIDKYSNHTSLQRIPGSFIKSYGGMAGIVNLSMDGGQPVHTKIVLDGIDLTNPQNGQTDLSNIPVEIMQQLYLGRSPNLYYGSGSFDGVVHIQPIINRSSIKLCAGSYGYISRSAGYTWFYPRIKLNVQYGNNISAGNYPITRNDSTMNRQNNNFSEGFFSSLFHFQKNQQQLFKGFFFSTDQDRGIPGSLSWPSPKANRKNNIDLIGLQYVYLMKDGHLRLHSYQRSSDEYFNDPDLSINSHHRVKVSGIKFNGHQKLNDHIEFNGVIDLKKESIRSSDVGDRNRKTIATGIQATFKFVDRLNIQPGYRTDILDDFIENTYDLTSSLNLSTLGNLTMSFGTGFHAPTFNDLYWVADSYSEGNPDLKIEHNQYRIVRWTNNLKSMTNVSLEYRRRYSDNLITWSSNENYIWKPKNIDKSERKNIIMSVSIPMISPSLFISGHVTRTVAIDINTQKTLQHVPKSSANIFINYKKRNLSIEFQGHYTGERLYQELDDNWEPVEITLNGFFDIGIGLHHLFPIQTHQLTLNLIIQNILDQNTDFFPDYPGPKRRIKLGIELIL